jgi:hypothetical protein
MDDSRFDSLARSLGTAGSRRRALGGLLAGTLGLLGSRTEHAAAKKKPCPPCKKRKQGKCKKKLPEGTGCTDSSGRGGTCQGGSCVAAVAPPPPDPCAGQPPGAPCPPCDRRGTTCLPGNSRSDACCSGTCLGTNTGPGVCGDDDVGGRPCYDNRDCNLFSGFTCIAFRCKKAVGVSCDQEAQCASGECGCAGTTCTCRKSSCGAITAPCNPTDPGGRDADCCEGSCTGCNVNTGQCVCAAT